MMVKKENVLLTILKFLGILCLSWLIWLIIFSMTGEVDDDGNIYELFPGMMLLLSLALALAVSLGLQYNRIRRLEQAIDSSQSSISIMEERNHQLLDKANRLVEKHQSLEKEAIIDVVQSQSKKSNHEASFAHESSQIESSEEFGQFLKEMPELKINQNVERLLQAIFETENELARWRLQYNQDVEGFNAAIHQFPVNLLAKVLKIKPKNYYLVADNFTEISDEMLGL